MTRLCNLPATQDLLRAIHKIVANNCFSGVQSAVCIVGLTLRGLKLSVQKIHTSALDLA